MAVWVAAYAAVGVGYVARYELGFSRYQIRGAAIVIALSIATLFVINYLYKTLLKSD
jgi:hypothetical protein